MKSKIPLYIAVFLFALFFLTGCTSPEKVTRSEEFVEKGQEAYENREYKKAVDKYIEALDIYPSNVDAYLGLMDIFVDKGFVEEAQELAEQAGMRLDDEEASRVYAMLGSLYYEQGNYEEAREAYENARDCEEGRIGLARVNIQLRDIDEAKRALRGRGETAEFFLLNAYLTLDDWEKGEEILGDLDSSEMSDDLERRVSRLEEFYDIDDDDVLYKNVSLAGEYINGGYPYLAISFLREQDDIDQYPDGQYFLGKAYLNYGDYEKAIEKLNNAMLLDIDEDDLYLALARAYVLNDDVNSSLDFYDLIASDVLEEYIGVLVENEMFDKADSVLSKLEESFLVNLMIAKVYYESEDLEKMSGMLDKLDEETNLTQHETEQLKRFKLLYEIENIEDENEVEGMIDRYSVFDRYNPEVYLFKGKLSIHREDIPEAKEHLERAIELDLQGDVAQEASELLASID